MTNPTPGGSAGGDDRAGQQRERRRRCAISSQQLVIICLCRRVLAQVVVDPRADLQVVRIGDLVGGHQPWPDRAVRVPRLAHRHRRRRALPIAHRHVVDDQVAGDDVGRRRPLDVAAARADDDAELALVVDPRRARRWALRSGPNGPVTHVICLLNTTGTSGFVHARLGDVVGVVRARSRGTSGGWAIGASRRTRRRARCSGAVRRQVGRPSTSAPSASSGAEIGRAALGSAWPTSMTSVAVDDAQAGAA